MKRPFRYALDPLCWVGCGLYALNSWALGEGMGGHFSRAYLNDLLLIPCALPLVLWVHASLGWRNKESYPTLNELLGHLLVWSIIAEGIGPKLMSHAVPDYGDVLAYTVGGMSAYAWWWRGEWAWKRGSGSCLVRI